eukprot:scaffold4478_cov65-Phaeocystis_antarctica.AAC.2
MSNPIVFTLAVLASVLSALVVQPSPHATPPASRQLGQASPRSTSLRHSAPTHFGGMLAGQKSLRR